MLTVVDGIALDDAEVESVEAELRSAGVPGEPMYGFDLDRTGPFMMKAAPPRDGF